MSDSPSVPPSPDPIEAWKEQRPGMEANAGSISAMAVALDRGDALVAALEATQQREKAVDDILGASPAPEIIAGLRSELDAERVAAHSAEDDAEMLRRHLANIESDLAAERVAHAATRAEADRLREALADAIECVESWAAYATDYFKEKWDLDADLARLRAALAGDTPPQPEPLNASDRDYHQDHLDDRVPYDDACKVCLSGDTPPQPEEPRWNGYTGRQLLMRCSQLEYTLENAGVKLPPQPETPT